MRVGVERSTAVDSPYEGESSSAVHVEVERGGIFRLWVFTCECVCGGVMWMREEVI